MKTSDKVILGYACFRKNGHFKWAYKNEIDASRREDEPYWLFKVGYDFGKETLIAEIPERYRERLYIDEFWCVTHGYWMRKLDEYIQQSLLINQEERR